LDTYRRRIPVCMNGRGLSESLVDLHRAWLSSSL
jgi:hypothetical protein